MRTIRWMLVSLVALGCTPPSAKPPAPQQQSQLRDIAAQTLSAEADRVRQEIVGEELERYIDHPLSFSAKQLSDQDKRLLAKLLQAAEVVEEINLLQINPQMLAYREEVSASGTEMDKRLFQRNHGPWCLESADVRCTVLRSMPPRVLGVTAWPQDFAAEELHKLRRLKESAALLSPFTVVRRKGSGYQALALSADPVLGPKLRQLSQHLKEAAALAEEPTLKAFLTSRAQSFLSPAPFPYDQSDLDWIALKGRWEVTVGPYETARDPYGLKGRFGMYLGLEDTAVTQQLEVFRQRSQQLENRLSQLVGRRLYQPRKIEPRTAIRAIELILASGDARLTRGATASYHLPTAGKAVEQGLSKKVILINQLKAFTPTMISRASVVLAPEQQTYVSEQAVIMLSTFHELCHSLGPVADLPLENDKGKSTVAKSLGEYAAVLDELKASTLALWLWEPSKRGRAAEEEVRQHYTTAVMQLVGLLQLQPSLPAIQAAAILFGSLLDQKAVTFDETQGRLAVNYRLFPRVLRTLAKQVLTLQLTGNREEAAKLFATYLEQKGGSYLMVDRVDRPRLRAKEAFRSADIKGLSMIYQISDLKVPPAPAKPAAAPPAKPAAAPPAKPAAAPPAKPAAAPPAKPAAAPPAKPAAAPPAKQKTSAKATEEATVKNATSTDNAAKKK